MSKKKALSQKNILEYRSEQCAKAIRRNKSMRSKCLITRPEFLQTVYVANLREQNSK